MGHFLFPFCNVLQFSLYNLKLSFWEDTHMETTYIHHFYKDLFFKGLNKNCPFQTFILFLCKQFPSFSFPACVRSVTERDGGERYGGERTERQQDDLVCTGQLQISDLHIEPPRLGCDFYLLRFHLSLNFWRENLVSYHGKNLGCISKPGWRLHATCRPGRLQLIWALFCHWGLLRHFHFAWTQLPPGYPFEVRGILEHMKFSGDHLSSFIVSDRYPKLLLKNAQRWVLGNESVQPRRNRLTEPQ